MKFSVRETVTIIETPAYCPITKASNNSHFHSSHFFALYFPSQCQWFFLSLLPFLILEIKNNCVQSHYTTRTAPRVIRSTKLSPVLQDSYLDGWPKTDTRCGNSFFFFLFPFEGDIKDCRAPQPCVMSLLLFLNYYFVLHFAMSAFSCIFTMLYNRSNKQPDLSFEFFSILLTFGRLKQ